MQPPLRTPEDFASALEEARQRLEGLPTAKPADAEHFDELLRRIADYHDRQPSSEKRLQEDRVRAFEDHLRAYGLRWPRSEAGTPDHWAPMVGGDLHLR
jgi:hypothetical protein